MTTSEELREWVGCPEWEFACYATDKQWWAWHNWRNATDDYPCNVNAEQFSWFLLFVACALEDES